MPSQGWNYIPEKPKAWTPPPFTHEVEIQMWADLHGVETAFTMTSVHAEDVPGAAEYLRTQVLALKQRLTPPPIPRRRKAASARPAKKRSR